MERVAPLSLAEHAWDNVGLLVGMGKDTDKLAIFILYLLLPLAFLADLHQLLLNRGSIPKDQGCSDHSPACLLDDRLYVGRGG